jgi:hypothetical protein
MHVHLGYYFFLNGLCAGLVAINPGDKSTSKDLKLLIIAECRFLGCGAV